MVAVGLGAFITYIVYNMFQRKHNRYRGRVPEEYQGLSAYPTMEIPTGYRWTHEGLYPERYSAENEERNIDWDFAYHLNYPREYWDSLDERIDREKTFRRNLKQSGVDGFQSAVDRRNYLWRPGGEVERAAGKFSRPNVMKDAQKEYNYMYPDEEPDSSCSGSSCNIMGGNKKKSNRK